ncbi:hypothetical protein BT63DRAFT_413881 [Microthyrium microscopicum]|uniref:MARVEL domain-containing protein n=1 Tax=Microthyrium microscopicum TaxID=703497 RepID=A0A6A6UB27_9PEZI|nr:hypothetical protein BT63DRAFT_413881 [Microthyrium microscopicum]
MVAIPSYGAAPLSATFLGVRVLQLICLIVILGLTGNFINAMVMADHEPSREIVGTISITAIVTLYTLVSVAFYWAIANMGLYIMAGLDFFILLAWIVVSVTVGKPLSYVNCYFPGRTTDGQVLEDLFSNLNKPGSLLPLEAWTGMNKSNCFETKAIWGFSIALTILFATSAVLLPTLRYKHGKMGGYLKQAV